MTRRASRTRRSREVHKRALSLLLLETCAVQDSETGYWYLHDVPSRRPAEGKGFSVFLRLIGWEGPPAKYTARGRLKRGWDRLWQKDFIHITGQTSSREITFHLTRTGARLLVDRLLKENKAVDPILFIENVLLGESPNDLLEKFVR